MVFIGSEPNQIRAERVLQYSIEANTKEQVDFVVMRNGLPGFDDWTNHGPTGFTLFRFAVPHLMGFEGMAIYLDCDMLVLGDIAELATYYRPGKWCQHADPQGDCVSVIDCSMFHDFPGQWPTIDELKSGKLRKWDVRGRLEPIISRTIPGEWNSMDKWSGIDTKLVHYTSLETQPWHPDPNRVYKKHPVELVESLWYRWESLADDEMREVT